MLHALIQLFWSVFKLIILKSNTYFRPSLGKCVKKLQKFCLDELKLQSYFQNGDANTTELIILRLKNI